VDLKLVDLGDGTFALRVSGDGLPVGAATSAKQDSIIAAIAATHVVRPATAAMVDRSGTIATGGASQVAMPANANRRYLLIQNPTSAAASFWVTFVTGNAAVNASPSIEIAPGVTLTFEASFVPTDVVNVNAPTTGQVYTMREA
jgi:hypothetical protein